MSSDALGFLLGLLTIGMTVSAFQLRRVFLAWASSGTWLLLAIFALSKSAVQWDIYYFLMFFSFAMLLATFFGGLTMREPKGVEEEEEDKYERIAKRYNRITGKTRRLDETFGGNGEGSHEERIKVMREKKENNRAKQWAKRGPPYER